MFSAMNTILRKLTSPTPYTSVIMNKTNSQFMLFSQYLICSNVYCFFKLKVTIIIQIMPSQSQNRLNLIISALNHLEKAMNKLPNTSKTYQTIHQNLNSCLQELKQYLQTCDQTNQIIVEMQAEIDRLQFQKHHILNKHHQILQNLEMLIFQKDYHQLLQKIDYHKSQPLEESILTFFTHSLDGISSNNTLNRSFVIESSENSRNQFLTSQRMEQIRMECQHYQRQKINNALKIVNSERQAFQNKQQIWLGIVYTKNAQEESIIFNEGNTKMQTSHDELQFSQISLTEGYEPKIAKLEPKACFSGKKVKSMVQLKQKSSKKKSLPKTSVKKEVQSRKNQENVEFQDDKIMKKKLIFVNQSNQKPIRKKVVKQVQGKNSKSMKKHLTIVG